MRNELMAEEVEIDPLGRGSALLASQNLPVERPCCSKIMHGEGKMKAGAIRHSGFVMFACERSRLCG